MKREPVIVRMIRESSVYKPEIDPAERSARFVDLYPRVLVGRIEVMNRLGQAASWVDELGGPGADAPGVDAPGVDVSWSKTGCPWCHRPCPSRRIHGAPPGEIMKVE